MSRPLIYVFPGQSSRDAKMFERAAEVDAQGAANALARFEALAQHPFDGTFGSNIDVQLAVHLVTRVYVDALAKSPLRPVASAGLSLGEYAHLTHIGALGRDAADRLVAARGRCYDAGPQGKMVAVAPCDAGEVASVLAQLRARHRIEEDDLAISNFNGPRQLVIAGRDDAVDLAIEAVEEELFAMTTVIERRVPMHVKRFAPVAQAFGRDLASAQWLAPHGTWWSNVHGAALDDPSSSALTDGMLAHVYRPVRWTELIDGLLSRHPEALLLEVGPGRVLTGLMARGRWHPEAKAMSLDNPRSNASFAERVQEVCDVCL